VELRHLRYFVAVAEERHFGHAARRLHIAQPPLSQQIRQLEAELGVRLLNRTTRRVELTPAGASFLGRARDVLAAAEAAAVEARRVDAGLEGRLVVGCVGSATYSLLPSLARRLREQMPAVDFSFRGEMLVPDQVDALLRGDVDLALLRPPVDTPGIALTSLRRERFIVALPEGHRLVGRRRLRVDDLREESFIGYPGLGRSVMSERVTALCREAGFEPRIRQEVGETSTLVTFVAAGLGVALVPEPVASLGVTGATYRPLSGVGTIELSAAIRSGDEAPHLARAMRELTGLLRERPR
jgi:DNA-binding transcriptional LysR family regulator